MTTARAGAVQRWIEALESGEYKELPPGQRAAYFYKGRYCPVGVGMVINGINIEKRQNTNMNSAQRMFAKKIGSEELASKVLGWFYDPKATFKTIAAKIRQHCEDTGAGLGEGKHE